jgi:hypothetical protein
VLFLSNNPTPGTDLTHAEAQHVINELSLTPNTTSLSRSPTNAAGRETRSRIVDGSNQTAGGDRPEFQSHPQRFDSESISVHDLEMACRKMHRYVCASSCTHTDFEPIHGSALGLLCFFLSFVSSMLNVRIFGAQCSYLRCSMFVSSMLNVRIVGAQYVALLFCREVACEREDEWVTTRKHGRLYKNQVRC